MDHKEALEKQVETLENQVAQFNSWQTDFQSKQQEINQKLDDNHNEIVSLLKSLFPNHSTFAQDLSQPQQLSQNNESVDIRAPFGEASIDQIQTYTLSETTNALQEHRLDCIEAKMLEVELVELLGMLRYGENEFVVVRTAVKMLMGNQILQVCQLFDNCSERNKSMVVLAQKIKREEMPYYNEVNIEFSEWKGGTTAETLNFGFTFSIVKAYVFGGSPEWVESVMVVVLIAIILCLPCLIDLEGTANPKASRERHSDGYCSMYEICGIRSDGKVLNCPFSSPAVKPNDRLSQKIQSLCPKITGCPVYLRKFLNLFCQLSSFLRQSLFINVTSMSKVKNNLTVGATDFFIIDAFGEGLYASCKEVKFGTMNTQALNFIRTSAQNFKEWFASIGKRVSPNLSGSPYVMTFKSTALESSGMTPMNVSIYSFGDIALGCSCGDCRSSSVCTNVAPPREHKKGSCLVRLESLYTKCVDLALAILYIVLISIFFWVGVSSTKRAHGMKLLGRIHYQMSMMMAKYISLLGRRMRPLPCRCLKIHLTMEKGFIFQ